MSNIPGTPEQAGGETQPDGSTKVYLPNLISDEFGVSASQARQEIMMGTVEIGGNEVTGDKLLLDADEIRGKEIVVIGDMRHYRTTFRG